MSIEFNLLGTALYILLMSLINLIKYAKLTYVYLKIQSVIQYSKNTL